MDIEENFNKLMDKNIICNKYINASELELNSDINIINKKEKYFMNIKCSLEKECKLEWLLESLGKLAILKWKKMDCEINEIKIYNPMQGTIITFDVKSWDKNEAFLKYLCEFRKVKYVENKKEIKDIEETETEVKEEQETEIKEEQETKTEIKEETEVEVKEISEKKKDLIEFKKLLKEFKDNNILLERIKMDMICIAEFYESRNNSNKYYIVFDTETTGLPKMRNNPPAENNLWAYDTARILQLSWACYDMDGNLTKEIDNHYIKPEGYKVGATEIHGITEEIANGGEKFETVMQLFRNDFAKAICLIGHNVTFDVNIIKSELIRRSKTEMLAEFKMPKKICTMLSLTDYVGIKTKTGKTKYPKQCELYEHVLGRKMLDAHNAKSDVKNLGEIITELIKNKKIKF